MSPDARDERIALNESRFREINDGVAGDLAHLRGRPPRIMFVCECARLDCREQVALSDDEYARLRADPMLFAIVPGHELPETEDVVDRNERFAVVRKHEDVRDTVEATDSRAR